MFGKQDENEDWGYDRARHMNQEAQIHTLQQRVDELSKRCVMLQEENEKLSTVIEGYRDFVDCMPIVYDEETGTCM